MALSLLGRGGFFDNTTMARAFASPFGTDSMFGDTALMPSFESPFSSGGMFDALQRRMDAVFEDEGGLGLEVSKAGDGLHVSTELPGFAEEDVTVDVHDGMLRIHAERTTEGDDGRSYSSVERSMRLPAGVTAEDVKASFQDGVLRLDVPALALEDDTTPADTPMSDDGNDDLDDDGDEDDIMNDREDEPPNTV